MINDLKNMKLYNIPYDIENLFLQQYIFDYTWIFVEGDQLINEILIRRIPNNNHNIITYYQQNCNYSH